MNNKEFIAEVAGRTGMKTTRVQQLMDTVWGWAAEAAAEGAFSASAGQGFVPGALFLSRKEP